MAIKLTNMKVLRHGAFFTLILLVFIKGIVSGKADTLRVMAYNVLYYGNGCQGPTAQYHQYLKTIVGYGNPDILSLEKMASIPTSVDDKSGAAPYGFADSIIKYALNSAFAGRYAYCPFTNSARANNMSVIFYDQHKLGFVNIVASYVNGTDFNTYKLYYKDPFLDKTHDTTFLYITPNHDKSGDEFEEVREMQIAGEMKSIGHHFKRLGNHINLGDFNARSSKEGFYQLLTTPPDTGFRFYDPPFYPDRVFKYPADWDHDAKFTAYFTTSTREMKGVPNSCGSAGGGKNWYDHIFLSSWIVNNANFVRYIPQSYRTIGNDGERYKVAINNANAHVNNSAPANVIEAIYQMSNKYPVMVDLEVTANSNGISIPDPEVFSSVITEQDEVIIKGFEASGKALQLSIIFPEALFGQEIKIELFSKDGKVQKAAKVTIRSAEMLLNCSELSENEYHIKISGKHNVILETDVKMQ